MKHLVEYPTGEERKNNPLRSFIALRAECGDIVENSGEFTTEEVMEVSCKRCLERYYNSLSSDELKEEMNSSGMVDGYYM